MQALGRADFPRKTPEGRGSTLRAGRWLSGTQTSSANLHPERCLPCRAHGLSPKSHSLRPPATGPPQLSPGPGDGSVSSAEPCTLHREPGVGWAYFTFLTLLKERVELGNAAFSLWSIPLLEAINLQAYDL